jgi:hypothetical protein
VNGLGQETFMADKVKRLLTRWRGSWLLLAQSAVWVLGIVAGFLLPPPVGTEAEGKVWVRFAQFVVTVIVGLVLLAALRWQRKKDTWRWAAVSASMLVLATGTFFGYQFSVAHWTARYDGNRVVVGAEQTALGREYQEQHPERTREEAVMDVAGAVTRLWTRESIDRRRLALAALYVLAMPLFTLCVIATVQAIRCATPDRPTRRRSRQKNAPRTSPSPDDAPIDSTERP